MLVEIKDGRVVGYLTASEAAKKLGVQEVTIRVWVKRNKIESLKIGNDHWIKEDIQFPARKRKIKLEG